MKCCVTVHPGKRSAHTTLKTFLMANCTRNTLIAKVFSMGTSTAAREKEIHLSLMVNTDGVSIFRSSNFGLWPVYFVISELPPEKRY